MIIVQIRMIIKKCDSNLCDFKNSNINIHVFIILNRKKCVFSITSRKNSVLKIERIKRFQLK